MQTIDVSLHLHVCRVLVPPVLCSALLTHACVCSVQGADPTSALQRFAEASGRGAGGVGGALHIMSLGQGQGPVAEARVRLAMRAGDWVCLQVRIGRDWHML